MSSLRSLKGFYIALIIDFVFFHFDSVFEASWIVSGV